MRHHGRALDMEVMTMPRSTIAVPLAAIVFAARSGLGNAADQLDGKKIFLAQKCETCHAVASAGIKATGKIKAPDLTGLSAKRDAKMLSEFLRRNTELNGKKHVKPFTGSDEEMGALIAWLQKETAATKKD
jgi:mono/diheme cytochrome c family protein